MGTFKTIGHQASLFEVFQPREDSNYWSTAFERTPFVRKESSQITNIAFSSDASLPSFALSCGTRVNIHNEPPEWNRTGSLTVCPLPVYGGEFRKDNRLFVCGCEDGIIRVFEMSTATLLRQFKGHKMAARACTFSRDGLKIGSAGDDKTVRLWDLSLGQELIKYSEFSDYVRNIASAPTDLNLWMASSYDRTVKMFDSRAQKCVRIIECPSIIEDISISPEGRVLAVACDRAIYLWDAVSSSNEAIACLQHHHKTITSICFASQGGYVLSASLDKHIKVYDMDPISNFKVVSTLVQSGSLVKIAVSPDDRYLATATSDNKLSILSRKQATVKQEEFRVGSVKVSRYFERLLENTPTAPAIRSAEGRNESSLEDKISVVDTKIDGQFPGAIRFRYYDRMLKRFEHSKALTVVMKDAFVRKNIDIAISVIDELIRRDVLRIALAGRNEKWVTKALRFAGQNYRHVSFQRVISEFINAIADVYGDALVAGDNSDLLIAFRYVCGVVDSEWELKYEANELVGAVECLLSQSQPLE